MSVLNNFFKTVNTLPELLLSHDEEVDFNINCPNFISEIIKSNMPTKTKNIFFKKFGYRYHFDTNFRKFADNGKLLFIDNEYIGLFKNPIIYDSFTKKNEEPMVCSSRCLINKRNDLKERNDEIKKYFPIKPDNNKRILIACANDDIYKEWENITSEILVTEEYISYLYGCNLFNNLPYMLNGNYHVDNLSEIYGDKIFDIILLEHCNINKYSNEKDFLNNLYMILKNDGLIILPVFSDGFNNDLFKEVGSFKSKFNGMNYLVLEKTIIHS